MKCKKVADLSEDVFGVFESARRVYSVDGIAPTILTNKGGSRATKILIEGKKDED